MPLCTIVGTGPGISLSVAKKFAREGFTLALIARNTDSIQPFTDEFKAQGISAQAYTADASDFAALEHTLQQIHQQQGLTDVLVYNVAVVRRAAATTIKPETLVEDFATNVAGALCAANQVIPHMKMQRKGTILFTGGGVGLEPHPMFASLSVGKSGIRSLCFALAAELGTYNIHVATVTIRGLVKEGTRFDPDYIAEEYWRLYAQPRHAFEREYIYQ
jgi:short-subunit dehydrogenase